ncbi:Protein of unknown function [Actinopolyspora mzabensis]|uniref:DUF4232 domain-containing protein n=1 Tax=Actinopolyspora mzabensis TaxID=995066 RepID=A0A1G9C017_ACTMZ|nr:DUF4232 domain-containing protein [Actinopolyspora mzabensis]SDK45042.1 Protein of unknown function [Actinopolyspora mzabensis]
MVPHRSNKLGTRVLAVSTTLLAGALLGGCGQQPASTNGVADSAGNALEQQSSSGTTTPTNEATGSGGEGSENGEDSGNPAAPADHREASTSTGTGTGDGNADKARAEDTSTEQGSGTSRCHTSMMAASLEGGHPGAGQRYAELKLRNTTGRTCVVYGYPGLEFTGSNGAALPTDVEWSAAPEPSNVRLAPGETTSTTLHWGVVPSGSGAGSGDCEPLPSVLRVTPPDETEMFHLRWDYGRVCGNGHVSATAFH